MEAHQTQMRTACFPCRCARRSTRLLRACGLGLCAGLLLGPGCLVPLPLSQEMPTDGGTLLEVTGANPPFGTQGPLMRTDPFNFQVDVTSDSPSVVGRLYVQVNGSCCDLNVDNSNITRFLQEADTLPVNPGSGRYTIDFRQTVLPCNLGFSASTAYVVPVLASGGFVDGPRGFRPEGKGIVDRGHYWTVICQ
jgi:hypothetical protein